MNKKKPIPLLKLTLFAGLLFLISLIIYLQFSTNSDSVLGKNKYDQQEQCSEKRTFNKIFQDKSYIVVLCYMNPLSAAVMTRDLNIKVYDEKSKDLIIDRDVEVIYDRSTPTLDVLFEDNKIIYFDRKEKEFTINMPPTKED